MWSRPTAALIGLAVLASAVAFVGLASIDGPTDRAAAKIPLPPKPYLQPTLLRELPRAHQGAAVCRRPGALCPDLAMRPPYELTPDVDYGQRVLRAANAVLSIGAGAVEVRGTRATPNTMTAVQHVHRKGTRRTYRVAGGAGRLLFKTIPGQGQIWKFDDAARVELWTTGAAPERVRVGPKLVYCLRDLRRLWGWQRSPRREVYPACSHSAKRQKLTIGTSPGWADIYPATYYEQWIDVEGLEGCYDLVHIADPRNRLVESDETNNAASMRVLLPAGPTTVSDC